MSIAARALPITRDLAPRRHLRALDGISRPTVRNNEAVAVDKRALIKKAVVGSMTVLLLYLGATVMCNASIYEISVLKEDARALQIKSQLIESQVDSLRSPQNLANSAKALGMVVNSNPVFLKVASGKVLGTATPVVHGTDTSQNLIANAAWFTRSKPQAVSRPKLDLPTAANTTKSVNPTNSGFSEVVLPSAGIPASPTH